MTSPVEVIIETVTTSRIVLGQSDLLQMVRKHLPLLFSDVDDSDKVILKFGQRHSYDEPIEVDDDTELTLLIVKKRNA